MKPLLSAIAAAFILFSTQGIAEQTTQPVVTSCANVVVVPPSQWICPYISRHLLSLNPLLACCRRYSRGER